MRHLDIVLASCVLCSGAAWQGPSTTIRRRLERRAADRDLLNRLGEKGLLVSSKEEDAEVGALLRALPASPAPTARALRGEWRLLYTTKSDFDARNPLGRRSDGTTPGLEAVFDRLLGADGAAAPQGSAAAAAASSSPSSSSPIQRAILTRLPSVDVFQNIDLADDGVSGRVDQVVDLGRVGTLRLSAAARLDAAGRVDFAFDLAYLQLQGGLRLPYPVPFRILGDEAKGYLDTLFLSDDLRVSKGNKGTTFVLRRIAPPPS